LIALAVLAPGLSIRRESEAAQVDTAACNGCTLCYQDCPYDAISLLPRSDGRKWEVQAEVDPARCVGCGICAGSCDSGAISLPQLPVVDQRRRIEGWIEEATATGEKPHLAFVCASSAGASLQIDPSTGTSAALPGYRILPVPCSGWVQRFTLERALRRGAEGVLVVGCGPTEPHFREGTRWTELRIAGEREPVLRREKVEAERIHFATLDRSRLGELQELAGRLRQGPVEEPAPRRKQRLVAASALVACAFGALIALGSDLPYRAPATTSQLVVSFKHAGSAGVHCRPISPEEKARLPIHMQRDEICERSRSQVRLRVVVDGEERLSRSYEPRGLRSDGNSVAVEHLPLAPGLHLVEVSIGGSADPAMWDFIDRREIRIEEGERTVVTFDKVLGFDWHLPET